MDQITQSFKEFYSQVLNSAPQIAAGIIVLIVFILLGLLSTRALRKVVGSRNDTSKKARILRRLFRWTFYAFGFTIALNIMGLSQAASSIIAAGGILTVVLGFAFREIGENLLAGLFMSFSPSFDVGDLIESNSTRGVVKQINIRDVHVRTADGVDIFIPSAMIYKNPLLNFTRDGLRRARFVIGFDYRNDVKKARELILTELKKTEGVLEIPKASVQVANFTTNYVELEIYFWINTHSEHADLSEVRTNVMEATQQILLQNQYILSSEISTAIEITEKKA